MVGYLLGIVLITPPAVRSFLSPRAGFIGYADHAVEPSAGFDIYWALYGALASGWLDAGCLSHYAQVAATDASTAECWHTLGFGREFTTAIRGTETLARADWPGDIRRARGQDLETIMRFIDALHRFEAAAPIWRPYLPETAEERRVQAQMLDDPACAQWIASQDGQPLAMQSFQPPPQYLSRMIVPERSIYLRHSYTEPAARGKGIGTSLFASAMAWAQEAGHRHCLLHFTTANLVSTRFWLAHGFRAIEYWLCHRLDDRTMSTRPDALGA